MMERHKFENFIEHLKQLKEIQVLLAVYRYYQADTDIDGVEVDMSGYAVNFANSTLGTDFRVSQIVEDYKLSELIKTNVPAYSYGDDALHYAISCYNTDEVTQGAAAVDGSVEMSYLFWQEGVGLLRNTSRPSWTVESTYLWYEREMPWVNPGSIMIQMNSNNVNPGFKIDNIKKHQIYFHAEDSFPQSVDIARKCPETTILVIPQYWNELFSPPEDVKDRIIIPAKDEFPGYPKVVRAYLALGKRLVAQY